MKRLQIITLSVGLMGIALLAVAGVYLQQLLSRDTATAIVLTTDESCDLARHACTARHADKSVRLVFKKPVQYLRKIDITLTGKGFQPEGINKVIIDFSMSGMQMGINRFALQKVANTADWQGMAILPVCVSGRKDWQVRLYLQTREGAYLAVYKLTVEG